MIRDLKPITEEDMLRNWALAEASSERRIPYLSDYLPDEIIRKITERRIQDISEDEWHELEQMIRATRVELLDSLLRLDAKWYSGHLKSGDVSKLRMMNWKPFVDLAGSRELSDLVLAFEKGSMPPKHHEFEEHLKKVEENFEISQMVGMPIVLGKSKESPYMIIEGFTRLSAMLLNINDGKRYEGLLNIILGIIPRLDEWEYS